MILRTSVCLSAIFIAAFAAAAGADENSPSLPTTYEVLINGESFRVELNRGSRSRAPRSRHDLPTCPPRGANAGAAAQYGPTGV